MNNIYVKSEKKAEIFGANNITVKDVSEITAPADIKERVEKIKLLKTADKKKTYLISIIDIIKVIEQNLPGHSVVSVGEPDTLVLYHPEKNRGSSWHPLKVIMLSLVFAVGAATAIMTFHNDAEVPKVFKAYHKMMTGEETDKPRTIQVSYLIGVALGITIFFNHGINRKNKDDLTPIEVEVADYNNTVLDAAADYLSAEKNKANAGS